MNEKINITLPDGNKKEYPEGITGYDIDMDITESLANSS